MKTPFDHRTTRSHAPPIRSCSSKKKKSRLDRKINLKTKASKIKSLIIIPCWARRHAQARFRQFFQFQKRKRKKTQKSDRRRRWKKRGDKKLQTNGKIPKRSFDLSKKWKPKISKYKGKSPARGLVGGSNRWFSSLDWWILLLVCSVKGERRHLFMFDGFVKIKRELPTVRKPLRTQLLRSAEVTSLVKVGFVLYLQISHTQFERALWLWFSTYINNDAPVAFHNNSSLTPVICFFIFYPLNFFSIPVSECLSVFLVFWIMAEKNNDKPSFKDVLCNEGKKTVEDGDSSNSESNVHHNRREQAHHGSQPDSTNKTNTPKPTQTQKIKAKTGSTSTCREEVHKLDQPANKGKGIADIPSYIQKLSKLREEAQKSKDTSLMGTIIGDPIDLSKIRTKLLKEWRNLHGEVQFIPKHNGWFELRFTNPIDKKKTWDGRPYHVSGQLLLLRAWRSNFDTITENNTRVDLWIRIPLLPNEFAHPEAIRTIIEDNGIGNFIRIDNNNEKKSGIRFTRILINTDLANESIEGEVLILIGKELKPFTLWFEDFPEGCGNYGADDHMFLSCPLRAPRNQKLQVTIKKSYSQSNTSCNPTLSHPFGDAEGWSKVNTNKRSTFEKGSSSSLQSKPYINGRGGVSVTFQKSKLTKSPNYTIKPSTMQQPQPPTPIPNQTSPPSPLVNVEQPTMVSSQKGSGGDNIGPIVSGPILEGIPVCTNAHQEDNPTFINPNVTPTPGPDPMLVVLEPSIHDNNYQVIPSAEKLSLEKIEELLNNDDLLDEELDDVNYLDDTYYGEEEEGAEEEDTMNTANEDISAHSNNSMVLKMKDMVVQTNEMSTTSSNKRKKDDGDDDTATSNHRGGKIPKI